MEDEMLKGVITAAAVYATVDDGCVRGPFYAF